MNQKSFILFAIIIAIAISAPAQDLVPSLKGYYDFSQEFQMYSGYLTLQQQPLIASHYIFVTSKNNPATDDVVLWLNGGPGCSSLLGFLQQHGPHVIRQGSDQLSTSKNPYSWNNNANVIYLESPPGVGFSINNDPNYIYGDKNTVRDNLQSISLWFKKFPQFSSNKFWISGESYAGMYIPLLSAEILKNIDKIIDDKILNFKGMMIGNGALNVSDYWRRQTVDLFYSKHYFYGPQIQSLISNCKYDPSDDSNPLCLLGMKLADQATNRINVYNSIGICYDVLHGISNKKPKGRFWYTPFMKKMFKGGQDEPYCSSNQDGIYLYLNDKEVQSQLHVPNIFWESCNDNINENFVRDSGTLHLFEDFKKAGLKVMLFTGNVDAIVSYIETEIYIEQLGWKMVKPKQAIVNPRGSLQGWVTWYDGLILYVLNGAGHMAPADKPNAALKMLQSFIMDKI